MLQCIYLFIILDPSPQIKKFWTVSESNSIDHKGPILQTSRRICHEKCNKWQSKTRNWKITMIKLIHNQYQILIIFISNINLMKSLIFSVTFPSRHIKFYIFHCTLIKVCAFCFPVQFQIDKLKIVDWSMANWIISYVLRE